MEAPPVIAAPRQRNSWWWLGVALLAGALLVLFLFNPSHYGFYPRCMLYVATGWYCPGCGALRATHHLLHGHLLTALRCNALLVLGAPYAAYCLAQFVLCWLKEKSPHFFWMQPKWVTVGTVVVILFTILRNIPVAPFTYLAPIE